MNRRQISLRDQQGFSLIELMVAMVVLLVGVGGTIAMLDGANARTVENRAREAGTALAREVVERSRSLAYEEIAPAGLAGRLQGMEGLADSDAGAAGWQIDRRGVRYTVDVSACSVDDANDNFGVRDGPSWCPGGGTGTLDTNPDDYKRVTVELTWDQREGRGRVREQTLINSPGNAAGPAVTSLTATGVTNNTVLCSNGGSCPSSIGFTATTSSTPATVSWTVDGAQQGAATGAGTAWSFNWQIASLSDGDYLIGARAHDRQGRSGATRVLTIKLNRSVPAKPRGFAAGRNGGIVDVEWVSNSERDIVGYRVYRQVPGDVPVQVTGTCADAPSGDRTKRNNCYDAAPPAGEVAYFVRAFDLGPDNQPRPGPESDRVTVTGAGDPPGPVTALRRVGANGLEWTAPAGSPPAAFYRIYRDGVAYANRYDRTGSGTETTWTDGRATGAHTYAVTAVSAQLAESQAVNAP